VPSMKVMDERTVAVFTKPGSYTRMPACTAKVSASLDTHLRDWVKVWERTSHSSSSRSPSPALLVSFLNAVAGMAFASTLTSIDLPVLLSVYTGIEVSAALRVRLGKHRDQVGVG
jgi:hypothetical protein